jgi:hypothetical protein
MKKLLTLTTLIALITIAIAQADDQRRAEKRESHHNYILERQQAYQVQGVPTSRIIIGKREIDGYRQRDGSRVWFERNNVVGVTR